MTEQWQVLFQIIYKQMYTAETWAERVVIYCSTVNPLPPEILAELYKMNDMILQEALQKNR